MKGWVKVKEGEDRIAMRIASSVLEENDIKNVILDKKDSSYLMFGKVELYVQNEQVLKARRLLQNL